jgi:putative membrane protein
MRPAVLLAVIPLLIATPSIAQPGSSAINQSGKEFLDFAAEVNQSEIEGGLAAEKKAEAPAVRAFARLMVLDHMQLESQLAAVAMENGIQLPNEPNEQSKRQMATLRDMTGSKFDAAFMQHMVQGHQQAVQRFKSEKDQAQSRPVEIVVGATLPIIEQHLALAQAVLSEINNQPSGTIGLAQSPNASRPVGTTGGEPSSSMHRNEGPSRQ